MKRTFWYRTLIVACGALVLLTLSLGGEEPARTGPATEKRFPPLRIPDGFQATLFACDPLIEYPSAIAIGPKPGSLFVAVDYLTGLGTGIERRDEIRLIEDTDGDGYADRTTVFADGLNSVQGLTYHDGTVYAMHAPYLTALRDTRGTGKADERRDLLTGLGLAPEQDQIRLHNANGVIAGHDGWLYLAMGDRGCDVKRPEGDRLVLEGGGILRCRPDGRDFHVFSSGLRNIYDVALDDDLNVFVRDNENDGGNYKIRICQSFFGADHGYPYLYHDRPDETLTPLADLGLGSSAGGLCYLEPLFPAEYRGNLFFCEWGRAVVRYPLKRSDGRFAPAKEIDFAAGAPADPYGLKPTDLVVARDGSLFVADWGDGQRPRRGRGRIYRIRPAGKKSEPALPGGLEEDVVRLDSDSSVERCEAQRAIERRGKPGAAAVAEAMKKNRLGVRGRAHAIWAMTKLEGMGATETLFALATSDPSPVVQAQAVRALADMGDPVLVNHRLVAETGETAFAQRIADLAGKAEPSVRLEAVVALGRLRWAETPSWLRKTIHKPDPVLAHAAQWALRRCGDRAAVLKLLDEPDSLPLRTVARRAVAEQYDKELVDGLIMRLRKETEAVRRREYADLLARIYKRPAAWTYWGFRPAERPANTVAWERTEAVEEALNDTLADLSPEARLDLLARMVREKIPARTATLGRWLAQERQPTTVATLLAALRGQSAAEICPHIERVVTDTKHSAANRLLAASLFRETTGGACEERLLAAAEKVEDGPILAELLRAIEARKLRSASALVRRKLASTDGAVRASAVMALAELGDREAEEPIRKLLADRDASVRAAAARATGKLTMASAGEQLLKLVQDSDAEVRRSSLDALCRLREPRALGVALAALADPETALSALVCIGELGGPEQAEAVVDLVKRRPAADLLAAAGRVFAGWAARKDPTPARRQQVEAAWANLHGSGVLLGWRVFGPISGDGAELARKVAAGERPPPDWRTVLSSGSDGRVSLVPERSANGSWLAWCEIAVGEKTPVEAFTSATAPATVWLNADEVYRRERPGVPGPYPERFETVLEKGTTRVLVRVTGVKETGEFQLRFRRKSATAEHERLTRSALSRAGNPAHGRQVFFNAEKSLCAKCHRVGDQGERVGPDLTGLGSRFSKAHLVESVLEPGRTVSPSFETVFIELKSGKVLTGIVVGMTETSFTLVDNEAKKHVIVRTDIESQKKQAGSTMPEGLEKRLTEDEFVDLMSFLVSLKESR